MQPPPGGGMPMTQGVPPPQRHPERPPPPNAGIQAVTKKVGDMTLQQQKYKVCVCVCVRACVRACVCVYVYTIFPQLILFFPVRYYLTTNNIDIVKIFISSAPSNSTACHFVTPGTV